MQKKKIEKIIACTYGSLIFGIMIGCLLFLFSLMQGEGEWVEYGLEKYDITVLMNASKENIICIILRKRIIQGVLFLVLMFMVSHSVASVLYCGGFGIYYGFVICDLIIKFGFWGFGYGLTCFFPHYVLYFLIIYFCGKMSIAKESYKDKYYKNVTILRLSAFFLIIISSFFVALFWEIRFQKNFLNVFFQYLV